MANRIAALFAMIAVLPVLLFIGLLVWLGSRGGIFHTQMRLGHRGRPFRIYKFRTLHRASGGAGLVAPVGDERITRVGRWLRGSRLDELPQLFNILKGEMHFVGPRPARPELWAAVDIDLRERALAFPPGLTSPATLRFICEDRLLAEFEQPAEVYRDILYPARVALDTRFFENRQRWSDLQVILATLRFMLGKHDDRACRRRVARLLRKQLPTHDLPDFARKSDDQ